MIKLSILIASFLLTAGVGGDASQYSRTLQTNANDGCVDTANGKNCSTHFNYTNGTTNYYNWTSNYTYKSSGWMYYTGVSSAPCLAGTTGGKCMAEEVALRLGDGWITLDSVMGNAATFTVSQLWKRTNVGWIQAVYTPVDGSSNQCFSTSSVAYNTTLKYTAKCIKGRANVTLFVFDQSFSTCAHSNVFDCQNWRNGNGGIAYYYFVFSCTSTPEFCGPPHSQNKTIQSGKGGGSQEAYTNRNSDSNSAGHSDSKRNSHDGSHSSESSSSISDEGTTSQFTGFHNGSQSHGDGHSASKEDHSGKGKDKDKDKGSQTSESEGSSSYSEYDSSYNDTYSVEVGGESEYSYLGHESNGHSGSDHGSQRESEKHSDSEHGDRHNGTHSDKDKDKGSYSSESEGSSWYSEYDSSYNDTYSEEVGGESEYSYSGSDHGSQRESEMHSNSEHQGSHSKGGDRHSGGEHSSGHHSSEGPFIALGEGSYSISGEGSYAGQSDSSSSGNGQGSHKDKHSESIGIGSAHSYSDRAEGQGSYIVSESGSHQKTEAKESNGGNGNMGGNDSHRSHAVPSEGNSASGLCPDDVLLLATVGSTKYKDVPITVLQQNGDSVRFSVTNAWSSKVARIWTEYHAAAGKQFVCSASDAIATHDVVYEAHCMHSFPKTVVDIYISDPSFHKSKDTAQVPSCCSPPADDTNPKVHYTFELSCLSQCSIGM